jgi:hypothetical protein
VLGGEAVLKLATAAWISWVDVARLERERVLWEWRVWPGRGGFGLWRSWARRGR